MLEEKRWSKIAIRKTNTNGGRISIIGYRSLCHHIDTFSIFKNSTIFRIKIHAIYKRTPNSWKDLNSKATETKCCCYFHVNRFLKFFHANRKIIEKSSFWNVFFSKMKNKTMKMDLLSVFVLQSFKSLTVTRCWCECVTKAQKFKKLKHKWNCSNKLLEMEIERMTKVDISNKRMRDYCIRYFDENDWMIIR